ncbi:hypothetical protein [Glycomyces sp. NPDC047010]|uniref:hypothetical protein n=1 Tax=Glycomyces sp. NPDC047010 TaxID=3155023 RepID=UPI0034070165
MFLVKTYGTHHILGTARVGVLLSALLAAAACTDAAPDKDAAPSDELPSSTTALPPEAIEDPEEAAKAAYIRYWTTLAESAAAPDGQFAEFEAIAADQALEQAQLTEQGLLDLGVHATGAYAHHVSVKDTLATDTGEVVQVVLVDCLDTTGTEVLDAADAPVEDEEYGFREVQSRVELLDGFWIITALTVQEIGTCDP